MVSPLHLVIQHRSPTPGVELRTLATNRHFPRHAHDQFGIGVIRSGSQRSWSGVGTVEAAPGDVIMVNPGEMHDGLPIDGQVRRWSMLYFDPKVLKEEVSDELTGPIELVRPVVSDPLLVGHFDRLFASLTTFEDGLARDENAVLFLVYALQKHGQSRCSNPMRTACVSKALRALDATPESNFGLRELAALSGISRYQLVRAFRRQIGITPHAYLIQRRVRRAQQLLAHGHTPVEAALMAGFADQSHLTRAFVRQLGVTPSRYRSAVV